ncbi:hypothetical protein VTN77DRAFT_6126 [Rasamsonia byssochlamydoides]|uniref:uncharacterized protein n=1 Tax=Rasamsonia byssochlamydoides TaxID=89139 RepID=UPI003742B153
MLLGKCLALCLVAHCAVSLRRLSRWHGRQPRVLDKRHSSGLAGARLSQTFPESRSAVPLPAAPFLAPSSEPRPLP